MAAILFITYKESRPSALGLSQLHFVKKVSTQAIMSNIVHISQQYPSLCALNILSIIYSLHDNFVV